MPAANYLPDVLETTEAERLATGFIFTENGHVATNNHVVQGASRIVVHLHDGREAPATVVGTDPETDLAVLKIDLKNVPSITFAPSEQAHVGDIVLAIGNPFGLDQTLTVGIISALNREMQSVNQRTIRGVIQTDAAINPGNSGGALIDAYGNLPNMNASELAILLPGVAGTVNDEGNYNGMTIRGIGASLCVMTGNEGDVTVGECIGWLAENPDTDVIAVYAEGIREAPGLIAALEAGPATVPMM